MFSLRKWNKMSENLQEVKCRRHHLKIARLTWRLDSWVFIGSKWSTVNAVFTKCSWSTVLLVLTEAIADPWISPSPRTRRKTRLIAHSWIQDRLEQQVKSYMWMRCRCQTWRETCRGMGHRLSWDHPRREKCQCVLAGTDHWQWNKAKCWGLN